jgi:hypothetical protein
MIHVIRINEVIPINIVFIDYVCDRERKRERKTISTRNWICYVRFKDFKEKLLPGTQMLITKRVFKNYVIERCMTGARSTKTETK